MGGNTTLQNTGVGGNGLGGTTGPAATPPAETSAGQQKFEGRRSKGWSALTAAVKMFGPEVIT